MSTGRYAAARRAAVETPAEYWAARAGGLRWFRHWRQVIDDSRLPFVRYFLGGETNLCVNAVDRHAAGPRRGQAALIWESAEIEELIRRRIGAIAVPRAVRVVGMLPETRSGKVMRRVIRALAEGGEPGDLSTIEEGAAVDEARAAIATTAGDG